MSPALAYVRAVLASRLAWRGDWALGVLADGGTAGLGLVVLLAVFAHVPALGGWERDALLLGWGFGEIGRGLAWSVGRGLYAVGSRYVVDGELDRVLLRPLSPLLQILLDQVHLGAWPQVAWGLGAIAWVRGGLHVADLGWVLLGGVCGAAILLGVLLALASVALVVPHRSSPASLAWQLGTWSGYPPEVLPLPLTLVLVTVLPWSFVGFAPACRLMEREVPWWVDLQPLVALATVGLGAWAWRRALRHYGSTGT